MFPMVPSNHRGGQETNAAWPPSVPSSRQPQASLAQEPEFSGCYVYPSAHFYSGLCLVNIAIFLNEKKSSSK